MAVVTNVTCRVAATETRADDLTTVKAPHLLDFAQTVASGTSSNQNDVVYSDTVVLTAAPTTYDLRGALTKAVGSLANFVKVTTIMIVNKSSTTGQSLTIGAGSNPWITWLIATGDGVVLGPGGVFLLHSPIDGYATTAGTGDILTLDPGANAFSVDIIFCGRSA